jgi:hypothetical protein
MTTSRGARDAPRTYTGSCHCGAVRFAFRSAPIVSGLRCNCTLCIRRGTVMTPHYVAPEDFVWLAGREALAIYRFGHRLVNHHFCPTCGVHPFHEPIERPGHHRVNLGCVAEVDALALPVEIVDGRSF